MLTGVALTGADGQSSQKDLISVSAEYPFVEWGILIGLPPKPRFPDKQWISKFEEQCYGASHPVNLSLHLCCSALEDMLDRGEYCSYRTTVFSRIQLNFHGFKITESQYDNLVRAILNSWLKQYEIIVQLDGINDWVLDKLGLIDGLRVSGLYDRSHGTGVKPESWPDPNPNWKVGYAGGLSPDNVVEELHKISKCCGEQDFWIDMETKVRTKKDGLNFFDLDKCRSVLEQVKSFIGDKHEKED